MGPMVKRFLDPQTKRTDVASCNRPVPLYVVHVDRLIKANVAQFLVRPRGDVGRHET